MRSIFVAATGLRAQSGRMRVVAENLANKDSVGQTPGADPYRRRIVSFEAEMDRQLGAKVVALDRIKDDMSEFKLKLDPGHPAADENGYVKTPNVDGLVEAMDMREAQRSYEANLNVITASRRMIGQTLDVLRA
ncbi:MAG: flagellar basal body rod protein FlgC [Pseudomonadota bacterium]